MPTTYYRTIELIASPNTRWAFFTLFAREMPQPIATKTAAIERPGAVGTGFREEGKMGEPYTLSGEIHYQSVDDAISGIKAFKLAAEGKLVKVHGITGQVEDKQMCRSVKILPPQPVLLAAGAMVSGCHAIGRCEIVLQAMQ